MKDRVDKSMGIVTRITEALARIKPTEPLRLANRESRQKRNCSDSLHDARVRKAVVQSPHRRDPKYLRR